MRTTRYTRAFWPPQFGQLERLKSEGALTDLSRLSLRVRWYAAILLLSIWILAPYFGSGDPPGVDAPTFLHFGWVFEQSLLGSGGPFLTDSWWYGGLPYLQAYSPGGYGFVGLIAAITPFGLATAFKLVMASALIGTGFATFWTARTLGLNPIYAFLAAALTLLSYPVLAGIGIFGWLPTLSSMPFAMAAYVFIEKWTSAQTRRNVLLAGVLLGISLIAHHMTAITFALAITIRMAVFAIDVPSARRASAQALALIAFATAAVSAWWAIPFLVNTISVGFQRELAGNWEFAASTFTSSVFDRGRIGVETYPSYIGYVQGVLGIGGAIYAIIYRSRFRGIAIVAAALFWFSAGTSLNPLIRIYPLSGFDVSRFAFYVAPLLALISASVVQQFATSERLRPYRAVPITLVMLILVIPVFDANASREFLEPVDEPAFVTESIAWIGANVPADSRVLAIGYRNWDGHWLPSRAGVPIMDGWYDEGAANWRNIREYRVMGWLANVDAARLHQIMSIEQTDYLVITEWDLTDSPALFETAVSERPDLFEVEALLEGTKVYRRI